MAKTQKNTVKTEASKTPSSNADFVEADVDTVPSSETDPIKVADVQKEASDPLAVMSRVVGCNSGELEPENAFWPFRPGQEQDSRSFHRALSRICSCGCDGAAS